MHGRLAKSLNAEFQIIDQYKKWNDGEKSKFFLLYAWFYNAIAFINPNQFAYFLVSGPHFSPIIMKFFRLNKNQKLICHLGDETMYFLYIKWYGTPMQFALKWILNQYDALFCEGQMAADLALLNGINKPKIYTTYLGVPAERQATLLNLSPKLESNNLIFISSGPSGWRTYYKGLDLMINAYRKAFEKIPNLSFTVVGNWDKDLQEKLMKDCSEECAKSIHFVGQTKKIDLYLSKASIYFHTSRGDAFPTVVLEAMSAGLMPIVSEWTGSKEVVAAVAPELVVELNEAKIVEKLIETTKIPLEERKIISLKMKEKSKQFTEEFALNHYQETFIKFIKDLKIEE
jgi:glycosyltransferase involved in cell wall biosynthesis